jgi:hypothetical protein
MQYARDFNIPEEDVRQRKEQLDALEQKFLHLVAETEAQEACRRATMSRSHAVANSGFSRSTPLVAGPSPFLYPLASMSAVPPSRRSDDSFASVPTTDSASLAMVSELTQMMATRALPTSNPGWITSPQLALSNASLSGMQSPRFAAVARHDSFHSVTHVPGRQDSLPTAALSLSRRDPLPSLTSFANAARLSREGRLSEIFANNARPIGLPLMRPNGSDPLLGSSGNWSVGQLQASLYGTSDRTNPSLDAMRLQMLHRDSLVQGARSTAMSWNQAGNMARESELAHLQRMLEHQEATLRHQASSLSTATLPPPAATQWQQSGKRSHSDATTEEKDGIEGRPSPKRSNYSQRDP